MRKFFFISFILLFGVVFQSTAKPSSPGIWAEIYTSKGNILAKLFYKKAPMTVLNFIELSQGDRNWKHPKTGKTTEGPLYKDLTFHRVIQNFMIQTGDPLGTGTGGPGYRFEDEFHPDLKHDKAGILSMANSGPNTNGSQFFITHKETPWLDNRHSVFGQVVEGQDVVNKIRQGDKLQKIVIYRIGKEAKQFNKNQAEKYSKLLLKEIQDRRRKKIPTTTKEPLAGRIPAKDQPLKSPGNFHFIVIGYQGIPGQGKFFPYTQDEAMRIAQKIVRYARSTDQPFIEIAKKYSDNQQQTTLPDFPYQAKMPPFFKPIFRMKPGQISDPINTRMGIFIFNRFEAQ